MGKLRESKWLIMQGMKLDVIFLLRFSQTSISSSPYAVTGASKVNKMMHSDPTKDIVNPEKERISKEFEKYRQSVKDHIAESKSKN